MSQRKADPTKHCKQCQRPMVRKRHPNRSLVSVEAFGRRMFCSNECRVAARVERRPYTDEQLLQAYREGGTYLGMSKRFGVSQGKVKADLLKLVPDLKPNKRSVPRGKDNPNWKGGRPKTSKNGGGLQYTILWMPEHPNARKGYVQEHVMVACEKYGVDKIVSPQCVHHVDLDKLNNHPDNLSLMKDIAQHHSRHWQLQHCAVDLMKRGLISYSDTEGYTLTDKALSL